MPLTEALLATGLAAFARIAGWMLFDPLVGRLPLALRLMLAAALAAALLPGLPATGIAPDGVPGLLALVMEAGWGALLALCVRLVFAAMEALLVWTGHTATGGLLTLTPAQAAPADAAWRALAGWLAAMAFLSAGGHLLIVDALRASFAAVPVATLPTDVRALVEAAGWLFAAGAQLALPLLALVLLVQLALAVVARTTPGLDMFAVGLGAAALGLTAAWIWAVPLIARGVGLGLEQMTAWLGLIVRP